jgi:molybdate transport system substrate-binding protein
MQNYFSRRGGIAKPWLILSGLAIAVVGLVWGLRQMTRPVEVSKPHDELVLLCAAAPLKPVEEISADYERQYGVKILIQPGNSGELLSRLRAAPERADLYLASDESFMDQARQLHLVAEVIPAARQHVVIGVAKGNPRKVHSLDDLLRDDVRVTLPDVKLTAVAESAERALRDKPAWRELLQRQREGRSVSTVGTVTAAAQTVKIGAADATFVWDATARQFDIDAVELPELQAKTKERAVLGIVTASPRATAALRFARYLTACDRGGKVFQKHSYEIFPDADTWEERPSLVLMAGAMLRPAIDDAVKHFSAREGVDINTIYNGCGILVAQMQAIRTANTASADRFPDAYFSCDVSFMKQVQQWFQASAIISRNDMVLCVAKGNPRHVKSIEDLERPELRIGLGHPEKSALGALSDNLLKKLHIHDKVHPALLAAAGDMLINQMRAGALDAIVVYRSNVLANAENAEKHLEIVEMNLKEAVATQPFAVAKDSKHHYLMRRLLETILTPESQERFRKVGFHWIAEGASP